MSHAQQGEAARLAKERDALRTQMEGLEADLQAARAASAAMAANLNTYKGEVEVERTEVKATLAELKAQLEAAVADKENYAAQVNEVWCMWMRAVRREREGGWGVGSIMRHAPHR